MLGAKKQNKTRKQNNELKMWGTGVKCRCEVIDGGAPSEKKNKSILAKYAWRCVSELKIVTVSCGLRAAQAINVCHIHVEITAT